MKVTRVLVTAVGGDVGQAVVKALRLAGRFDVFGCDSDVAGVGALFVECFLAPHASEPGYVEFLDQLCRRMGIAAVLPASEAEIAVLSQLAPAMELPHGAKVVCQPRNYVETYGDKLHAMRSLAGKVPLAPFADGTDREEVAALVRCVGFPLVVKPRRSSGSRFLRIVQNKAELAVALSEVPSPLVQQFLDGAGQEYSGAAFSDGNSCAVIAFRRSLGQVGCSWYAETSEDPEVIEYMRAIARASGLRGSANIQTRKTQDGVRLLEINPRFSSLAAARAVCGFNDVAWSVDLVLGRPFECRDGGYRRIRFRRFFHEAVDFGAGFHTLAEWRPREMQGVARRV